MMLSRFALITTLAASGLLAALSPAGLHAQTAPAAATTTAATTTTTAATPAAIRMPAPPAIAARAYVLVDVHAGKQVLASKELDMPMEPASLTKLMTAYIVFDALRSKAITLDQRLPISEKAWKMPGSRMFVDPSMQVRVDDLIKGMVVQSGNDATMALAEGIAGSEEAFVRRMNDTAQLLGLGSTSYRNPEGLTAPGHTTTARDMAVLATRLMEDFPQYMPYYAIKQWHYPGTPTSNQNNRNLLLFRDPTVDGLKTGHTRAAGYNLVATARRAMPNMPQERRLLAVVFGTASEAARANETQKLLNWGYSAYENLVLFQPQQPVQQARVWMGDQQQVALGRREAITVAVPNGQARHIRIQVQRPEPIMAPLRRDEPLGTLHITLGDHPVSSLPLHVLHPVERGGFLRRMWDTIRLWFQRDDGQDQAAAST